MRAHGGWTVPFRLGEAVVFFGQPYYYDRIGDYVRGIGYRNVVAIDYVYDDYDDDDDEESGEYLDYYQRRDYEYNEYERVYKYISCFWYLGTTSSLTT